MDKKYMVLLKENYLNDPIKKWEGEVFDNNSEAVDYYVKANRHGDFVLLQISRER